MPIPQRTRYSKASRKKKRKPATLTEIHQAYLPGQSLADLTQEAIGKTAAVTQADEYRVQDYIKGKSARELAERARHQEVDFGDLLR